jgi:hypothetical protein
MPQYDYLACDLLTNTPLADLELYGTYFERVLSAPAQGTGTLRLGTNIFNDQLLIDSTIPWRTALYVYRDGTPLWGGIIGSRTYASESKTLQFSFSTFEAFIAGQVVASSLAITQQDKLQIFKQLLELMATQPNSDIGLDTSLLDGLESGQLQDLLINDYDYVFFSDVINNLAQAVNGFDWTIDVVDSGVSQQPAKIVRAGYPTIAPAGPPNLIFDYPGAIDTYWVTESGANTGVTIAELGAGTGTAMLRSILTNGAALADGFPNIWQVDSRKDVTNQQQLDHLAQGKAKQLAPVVTVPTIQLKSDRVPAFEDWSALGSSFRVSINDCRFPVKEDGTPQEFSSRMLGWQLYPETSEQTEMLSFTVEGGDIADGAV